MSYQSTEDVFEKRKQDRKLAAKAPIEQKLQTVVKLQKINYIVKTSAGKVVPSRPWK